jgi:hypothetical protein
MSPNTGTGTGRYRYPATLLNQLREKKLQSLESITRYTGNRTVRYRFENLFKIMIHKQKLIPGTGINGEVIIYLPVFNRFHVS